MCLVVGLCVTGGPVCGRGRGDSDVKLLGVYEKRIGNKWAVSVVCRLASWLACKAGPWRSTASDRWSAKQASTGAGRRSRLRKCADGIGEPHRAPPGGQHLPSRALARPRSLADSRRSPPRIFLRGWVRVFSFLPTESRWEVWSSSTRAQHAPGTAQAAGPTMCEA